MRNAESADRFGRIKEQLRDEIRPVMTKEIADAVRAMSGLPDAEVTLAVGMMLGHAVSWTGGLHAELAGQLLKEEAARYRSLVKAAAKHDRKKGR